MSAAHTPGPWGIAWGGGHALIVPNNGGATIAGVPYSTDKEIPKAEANARLIAAAPDYHKGALAFIAYEDAMSSGDDISAMIHYNNASKLLRAANAKATGLAP